MCSVRLLYLYELVHPRARLNSALCASNSNLAYPRVHSFFELRLKIALKALTSLVDDFASF